MIKRILDLTISAALILIFSPLFIIIAVAIVLDSPGPVFFTQERRGKDFALFTMIKFRSLRNKMPDPSERYEMTQEDPRITAVGHVIRKTSLDELPQLFNVLMGSMSMVGPRPLVEWESQLSLPRYAERYSVKPGITGLSQLSGRNTIDFDARCAFDVEYVRRRSNLLDLMLMIKTPIVLFRSEEIYPTDDSRNSAAGT